MGTAKCRFQEQMAAGWKEACAALASNPMEAAAISDMIEYMDEENYEPLSEFLPNGFGKDFVPEFLETGDIFGFLECEDVEGDRALILADELSEVLMRFGVAKNIFMAESFDERLVDIP